MRYPEKKKYFVSNYPKEIMSYCDGYNECIDDTRKLNEEEPTILDDWSVHGVRIEKDGKRIDPKDFYKQAQPAKVLSVEEIVD